MANIVQIKYKGDIYDINSKYIQGEDGTAKDWDDIEDMVDSKIGDAIAASY